LWSFSWCVPLYEFTKTADRKIKVRPDFEGAIAPVQKLERFFHVSEGFHAFALQYFRYVIAHTHPHRAWTKNDRPKARTIRS
jgi:hypothetical protein